MRKFRPSPALALGPQFCPVLLGRLLCVALILPGGCFPHRVRLCAPHSSARRVTPIRPWPALVVLHLSPESHVVLGSLGDLLLFIPFPCPHPGNPSCFSRQWGNSCSPAHCHFDGALVGSQINVLSVKIIITNHQLWVWEGFLFLFLFL